MKYLCAGEHTLVARFGANESPLRQFSILGQQETQLHLVVAGPSAGTRPPPVAVDVVSDEPSPSNSLSWVLGATGAALLVGSGALWLSREAAARGYNEEIEEISALDPASDEFIRRRSGAEQDREQVKAFGLAAGLAGAAGLAAVSIAWIAYESKVDEGLSARFRPVVTPSQLGLSAVGHF